MLGSDNMTVGEINTAPAVAELRGHWRCPGWFGVTKHCRDVGGSGRPGKDNLE